LPACKFHCHRAWERGDWTRQLDLLLLLSFIAALVDPLILETQLLVWRCQWIHDGSIKAKHRAIAFYTPIQRRGEKEWEKGEERGGRAPMPPSLSKPIWPRGWYQARLYECPYCYP
jgi:hypothetical protein